MSLTAPWWLCGLLVLPLAWLLARASRGRARRFAVRFPAASSVELATSAAARWQRRLPAALIGLALIAGILTVAGPRVTRSVPTGDVSIMLVLDHSGSMAADDVAPSRESAAIRAANAFIDQLPANARVGALAFSTVPDTVQQPSTDHAAARAVIDQQIPDGGTDTGPALAQALAALGGSDRHHPPSAIVLLSDGAANLGVDPVTVAREARADGIPIDTVAVGTPNGVLDTGPFTAPIPVPPDPQLMRAIAASSGGRSFDAQTADELSSIYRSLGQRLATRRTREDISWILALIAAILLAAAAAANLRVASRIG